MGVTCMSGAGTSGLPLKDGASLVQKIGSVFCEKAAGGISSFPQLLAREHFYWGESIHIPRAPPPVPQHPM